MERSAAKSPSLYSRMTINVRARRLTDFGVRELALAFLLRRGSKHICDLLATPEDQFIRNHFTKTARKAAASRRTPKAAGLKPGTYKTTWRTIREPGWMPKPLPLRGTPLGKTPLPLEGRGVGPAAPPPATAIGGAPNGTGPDGSEPRDCE